VGSSSSNKSGCIKQDPRQFGAHAPTAAQLLHAAVHVLLYKADALQHPLDAHVMV
jgi:hypothetical protein